MQVIQEFFSTLLMIFYGTTPFSLILLLLLGGWVGILRRWEDALIYAIGVICVILAVLIWPFPKLAYWVIPIVPIEVGFFIGCYYRIKLALSAKK